MFIQKKSNGNRVVAGEEILEENVAVEDEAMDDPAIEDGAGEGEVIVDPEATDLLFEAEDVAELIAEVTGEAVEVTVEDDSVEFAVGEDVFTVHAEGDEEMLEACTRKTLRGKKSVAASTRRPAPKARVAASARTGRAVRKLPARRK